MAIIAYHNLTVGDAVAHREDIEPAFDGIVERFERGEYFVVWKDGTSGWYPRGDLVHRYDFDYSELVTPP